MTKSTKTLYPSSGQGSDPRIGRKRNIQLSRRHTHPIRVRITQSGGSDELVEEYKLNAPFSIGYGDHCEVKLPRGDGPDRLFEFAPMGDSNTIAVPLERAIKIGGFDISVDGEIVSNSKIEVEPGSSVKILDNKTNQQVELSVESMQRWNQRLQPLYWITGFLLLLICGAGYLVFQNFQKTEERFEDTELRLERTETDISEKSVLLEEILTKFDTRQLKLEQGLAEISEVHNDQIAKIRMDFSSQLKSINEAAQKSLSSIAESDKVSREQLLEQTRIEIATLEAEMSDRLIMTTEQIKAAQAHLYVQNTARIESLEQESTLFKDVLLESQKAVIYIRTTYTLESEITGQKAEVDHFGTGFTIGSNGLSIAPQHVLKPWLYDDNTLAMQEIGMVKKPEDSVTYTIWTSEQQVLAKSENTEEKKYQTESAFNSRSEERGVSVIYAPTPTTAPTVIASPIGAVTVNRPRVGHTDIAVLQLVDFEREFNTILIAKETDKVEPMDEIILVGYPLSRLHDGKSIPQGIKGFVRRQTQDLLELDTALHPGSSGAPVLNRNAVVIGMAVALLTSDTYGIAVPARYLNNAIEQAGDSIYQLKHTLMNKNCFTGELNEAFDQNLWTAMQNPECSKE